MPRVQRTTPLEIVRTAAVEVTACSPERPGSRPVERDAFDERAFPDDLYGVTPSSLADLGDDDLGPLQLAWGLAKTQVLRARPRRERGRPRPRPCGVDRSAAHRRRPSAALPVARWPRVRPGAASASSLRPSWSVSSKRSMATPPTVSIAGRVHGDPGGGEADRHRVDEAVAVGAPHLAQRVPGRCVAVEVDLEVGRRLGDDGVAQRRLDRSFELRGACPTAVENGPPVRTVYDSHDRAVGPGDRGGLDDVDPADGEHAGHRAEQARDGRARRSRSAPRSSPTAAIVTLILAVVGGAGRAAPRDGRSCRAVARAGRRAARSGCGRPGRRSSRVAGLRRGALRSAEPAAPAGEVGSVEHLQQAGEEVVESVALPRLERTDRQ